MINAYILLVMQPGYSEKAIRRIRTLSSVEKISVIAGEYDIVVRVGVPTMEALLRINQKLQQIPGLEKTTTHVIEKELAI